MRLALGFFVQARAAKCFSQTAAAPSGRRKGPHKVRARGDLSQAGGRGTGFARPQAQRPPRGARSYTKRVIVVLFSSRGTRDWPRQTAGAASPSGGKELHKARGRRALFKQGPRDWLRQTAGAAAPPGGRALHAVSNRGGHLLAYLACFFDLVFEVTLKTERDAGHQSDRSK